MNKQKMMIAAAMAICLTGCGSKIGKNSSNADQTTTTAKAAAVTSLESAPDAPAVTTSADKKVTAQEVKYAEYSETQEAEAQTLPEGLTADKTREGFSGEGYVTGIDPQHSLKFSFELPESQYYNISVTVASEEESLCLVSAGGVTVGEFKSAASSGFTIVTFSNIKLEKGKTELEVSAESGKIDLDCVSVVSSTEIRDLDLTLSQYALSDKNADYNAKALYEYICEGSGKRVLTGQHDTAGTLTETLKIYELTGRRPAIRFGDMMPVTQEMTASDSEIENARSWAKDGGIVSYMWHWADPIGGEKYYADETDFDLSKAVTAEDIALLPIDEIEKLCEEKKISSECLAIVKDIDAVSAELAKLRDDGIAVIWRPLHEASNGYFWWGHDAESYKWLWKLLYQRQTGYHKLSNLIWVWSAQNSGWYVGDDMCDIISADIYDKGNLSGHAERLVFLKKICATKPIVMSECGTTPGIQQLADERALWGFIGQWGGSFLMNADSSINEEYNSPDDLTDFYSNDLTITREELPDLSARAKELEEADKKAADEAQKAATATTTTAAETVPPADSQTTTTTATTAASAAS